MNYEPRMKAGPLRNGWERGHGSVFHAVPVDGLDQADALCGAWPSIMWSSWRPDGQAVTCPRCLKKLAKAASEQPSWDDYRKAAEGLVP